MEPQKFVVRLLDQDANLLAWAEVYAVPKPQERGASCPFWSTTGPTQFVITKAGVAVEITVHWCDLDVARRNALVEHVAVEVGQVFAFAWLEPIWLVPGTRDVPLPTTTSQKSVTVNVGSGSLVGAPGR